MHNYKAPLKDMRFAMQELAELKDICEIPSFEAIDIQTFVLHRQTFVRV